MVYEPKLDRQGFADRQSIKNRRPRPSINYTQRDDVRDLMKSPAGQNYGNMMDLQSQAVRHGGFEAGDPRVDELKQARRQYNRQDKYNIADLLGYTPQAVNEKYRQNSGVLREHAGPTYKQMYPISDMAHRVTGSGGLTGLILQEAFGKTKKKGRDCFEDLRNMGRDILEGVGIGGAIDSNEATEEVLQNYADRTFPKDIHPGTGPAESPDFFIPEEITREEQIQALVDAEQAKIDNFETRISSDLLDDAINSQWPSTNYEDYMEREQADIPFDQGKEDYIRRQNEYVSPPSVFPGNVRQDPQETDKWMRYLTAPELGTQNPQGGFEKFQEYPYPEIGIEFGGQDDPPPPIVPFDQGREDYIRSQNEYVSPPPVFPGNIRQDPQSTDKYLRWLMSDPLKFPPRGPHDPFDPDQQVFENDEEYRAWLRRKRLGY